MPKTLPLGKIRTDGGTQVRVELDKDTFLDYGRQMAAGVEFPPVDVFHDGSTYWLADGFHRFFGARDNGLTEIAVKIHRGTVRDAILFAIGANATHGKPRLNKDKRHAVEMLLADEAWREWSDRTLADVAHVDHVTVSRIKNELLQSNSCDPFPETTMGKDGKRRKKPKRKPKNATLPTPTFVDDESPKADNETRDEPEANEPAATDPCEDFTDRLLKWCRMQLDNLDLTPGQMATAMRRAANQVGEW